LALLEQKLERTAEEPVARFRLTVILTNLLIDLGQFDRAEALIGDALAGLGTAPDPIALARCLWTESRLQTARGSSELALGYAEDALAIIKATEHEEYAARAHHLVAYIELERGNPARALELLTDAMPLIERGRDARQFALFRLEKARALAALGELEQAQALAGELVVEVEHLSPVDAARSVSVLADVFAETGDVSRALELYETAADTLADLDNAPMLVSVYTRWSDLLAKTGNTERALEVARRALTARAGSRA
jgi:tetratricopeptide (TPR) repeat protein